MHRILHPVPEPPPETIEVTGDRLHHLARVLRAKPGDPVEVFDGKGRSFDARVEAIDADSAKVRLGAQRATAAPRRIEIIQGLPKGTKLDWVLEKGTELGAAAFWPVLTQRSVAKGEKLTRWRRIVEEAARQSGRSDVPTVHEVRPLAEVSPPGAALIVLDEEERDITLSQALPAGPVALVIGPEGGLDRSEVDQLRAHGARTVTLGRIILRTETAALAALAVIRHADGDLG